MFRPTSALPKQTDADSLEITMQCIFCETENPEGALFCKKCGRRLDGMSLCGACGKTTPVDGEFCIHCGANRNAPVYLMPVRFPAPGPTVSEAADEPPVRHDVTANCGAQSGALAVSERKQRAVKERKPCAPRQGGLLSKKAALFRKISDIGALVAALISVIFTFLIGVSVTVGAGGVSAGNPAVGYGLFYFFHDAYQALSAFAEGSTGAQLATNGAVLGTVCTVVILAGVAFCAVFTVLRLIAVLQKKTDKSCLAPAAMTFFAYICGVVLFNLCITESVEVAGVTTSVTANGATIAGIVLGAIVLTASVVLGAIARGIGNDVRGYCIRLGVSAGYAVCALVAVGLAAGGAVAVTTDLMGVSTSMKYGVGAFFEMLATSAATVSEGDAWTAFMAMSNMSLIFTVVMVVALVAFSVCLALSLSDIAASAGQMIGQKTPLLVLLSGVFAVVAALAMIVVSVSYTGWLASETTSAALGVPIGIAIAGLGCIVCAVYLLISRKKQKQIGHSGDIGACAA